MSEKIVLIDGHSILNRAFYGVPLLTNSEGLHTNAVYGFLNILFKILEEEKPDYLTVAFDVHAPTFRHNMYEPYKGTRHAMPEELREQVPVMKEVLQAMGVVIMELPGYEADDILGTLAKESEAAGMKVCVVSGDRDLLQLATDQIQIRIPKTKRTGTEIENYYTADVIEKYGVTPIQIIDLKALMGDSSDNIPGIPGVGEKTATKIIGQYGSIEEAFAHVEEITPNRAKESLRNHYDLAQLSKDLATIYLNVPLEYDREKARIDSLFTEEAYQLFQKLEFKNLLGKFSREAKSEQENLLGKIGTEVTDFGEAERIFTEAKNSPLVGATFVKEKDFFAIGLCYQEDASFYIPEGGFLTRQYLVNQLEEIMEKTELSAMDLKGIMKECSHKPAGQCWDIGIAAYLLNPLKSQYTYDDIGKTYLDQTMPSKEELLKKTKLEKAVLECPEDVLKWVSLEAFVAFSAVQPMKKALEAEGMYDLYHNIELPLLFTLDDMEKEGILVEAEALKVYGDQLGVRIQELELEIHEMAGENFNINSPKQLGVILFEKLNLPNAKKTKTGYSTAADVLEKLAFDYPIVKSILEYRQLTKLKSTYADGLANFIGEDGRIHSTFNQTITATGRLSSTDPNLQNIPIRMELGRLIRKVFVPRKDYIFIDADYSQIELRVLAHMSGDQRLIQAYREADDIHRLTASQVFHVPFDEVTDLQRRNAKAVNFGIVYGISSFGLSQDLSITRKEAQDYIEKYFETYPGIKLFLDQLVVDAKEKGYVTSLFGRIRPVPELKSSNFMQRSFGERVAMNAPIQGTAADIIKIAMIRVQAELKRRKLKSKLILQVHDELLIEAHEEEKEQIKEILRTEMMGAADLLVPLEIDMHEGKNWYEAK